MRDYRLMRDLMARADDGGVTLRQLSYGLPAEDVISESQRLMVDGLIDGDVSVRSFTDIDRFAISGLTAEGREFWRLIENDKVWALILQTLDAARIDVPYPLLKEVCEEIVRRYVTSFIPDNI